MTNDLIAQLEAATEGSRELGDEVLRICGWHERYPHEGGILLPDMWVAPDGSQIHGSKRPNPTESIDAALTLVPEGWTVSIFIDEGLASVELGTQHRSHSRPLALGICIAALKSHIS